MSEAVVQGDFNVIRLNGMYHVTFRPDATPDWFRIIASFYTYERAWSYCDVERVLCDDTCTGDEGKAGNLSPPDVGPVSTAGQQAVSEMVRHVYDDGGLVEPLPVEDFAQHPEEGEDPKAYLRRQYEQAIAKEADAAEVEVLPPADEPTTELTINQRCVIAYFREKANELALINASFRQIADASGVSRSGILAVVEALERRGLIEIVERGSPATSSVFRLRPDVSAPIVTDGPTCASCDRPRSPSSAAQCRSCYEQGRPRLSVPTEEGGKS